MGSRLRGMLRLPAAFLVIAIALGPPIADQEVNRNRRTGKDAIADCSELIRLNPQDAAAYFNRGYIYGELGEFDAAITDFTRAIDLDPNFGQPRTEARRCCG
jgi:tetratricopeptide (TPR) repeat protein